ncbi:MAG: hypothetical protein JO147_13935 [Actinobacteria bacterium]|nr:hypothetical protein [Actinomycetota bacterium]
MRIYVPATSSMLARLAEVQVVAASPVTAFAVTPGLRSWYVAGDEEELEFAALSAAARASLRLIDEDLSADRRRVVVVAEVSDADVTVHDDLDRGVVRLTEPVRLLDVVAFHVDLDDAREAIAAASAAILRADLGDDAAQEIVDDAEGFDLAWYATQELPDLLR